MKGLLGLEFWARFWSLDFRALALARVFTGLVLVVDLVNRLRFAHVFYSSQGVYPRSLIFENRFNPPLPSLHLFHDGWGFQVALLGLQLVCAVGVLVGYRTRLCTALSWYLMLSLQLRNPLVNNSGDSLLLAYLFWAVFLPWGRCWSIDARSEAGAPRATVLSAATVGFCSQVVCVYLFAALHKLNPMWWTEQNAVYYALSVGHHATGWADWLLPHRELLQVLSRGVIVGEFCLALTVLAPFPAVRLVALGAGALMHLGFGLFLAIGTFRYVPLIGLLALLPSPVFQEATREGVDEQLGRWWTVPLLALCLLTWAVNIEMLGRGKPVLLPVQITRYAPTLLGAQHWNVFSGQGLNRSGWFAVEVVTEDGTSYDAWRSDLPWSREAPEEIWRSYPDDRWRKWMMNLAGLPSETGIARHFARWCRTEWNARHPEKKAVKVRVWHAVETTPLEGAPDPAQWYLLGETGVVEP